MAGYYYTNNKKDDDESGDKRSVSSKVLLYVGLVSGIILAILLLVLATNNTNSGKNNLSNNQMQNNEAEQEKTNSALDVARNNTTVTPPKSAVDFDTDNKLRAEDLDIWHMYDSNHNSMVEADDNQNSGEENTETNDNSDVSESTEEKDDEQTEEEDGLIDGVYLNTIDFANLKIVDQKMHYYKNDNEISKIGVEINSDSGVVDFNILKNNGIQFAMIRLGMRGYDSGVISADSTFENNIEAASKNGVEVGVYFSSRAVTEDEARAEADFCADKLAGYKVNYPVAFLFEGEMFEEARTDFMNEENRTKVLKAFLKQIKQRGYTPIVYGTDKYLLNDIQPEDILTEYDVLLSDGSKMPEYPYQYKMWKYLSNTVVPGVERTASYLISFVDYSGR